MRFIASLFVGFLALSVQTAGAVPKNDAEREAALKSLHWTDGEKLTLPNSRASLNTPPEFRQLLGKDASTMWEVLGGVEAPPGIEAMIYDPKSETIVYFLKHGDGFVRLDDWADIDADEMLKSISESTEAENARRRENGVSPLHIVGWAERPHLDREKNTVQWAIESREGETGTNVNRVSLMLLRSGYEKLIWIGSKRDDDTGLLKAGQDNFIANQGTRYTDFKPGDKVADYGIAGLVAAVLGVKLATKLGLIALIAVFAKKFAVLIVLPFLFLFKKLKAFFVRGGTPPAPPTPST